jgi:hypothetical protein
VKRTVREDKSSEGKYKRRKAKRTKNERCPELSSFRDRFSILLTIIISKLFPPGTRNTRSSLQEQRRNRRYERTTGRSAKIREEKRREDNTK